MRTCLGLWCARVRVRCQMALMPGGVTGVNGRLRKNFDCRKVAYGCPLDGTLLRIYVESHAGTLDAMAREGLSQCRTTRLSRWGDRLTATTDGF